MLSEELQIYQTTYKLIKLLYTYERNIPKSVRYGEYQRAIALMFDALDVIYLANRDTDRRGEQLERYLELTGAVRGRIRLFGELGYLGVKQKTNLMWLVENCRRQATGWRNKAQRTT